MILIKNALNLDGFHTSILIDNNKIVKIGAVGDISAKDLTIIDGKNKLAISPFFNAHTHAAMTLFRGYQDDLRLSEWLEKIFNLESRYVNPQMVYWCSKLAFLEMIQCGTSGCMDMYFFEEEVAKAAIEAGFRVVIGEGLLSFKAPGCESFKLCLNKTKSLKKQFEKEDLVRVSFAPHSLYTIEIDDLKLLASSIERNDILQIHLAETLQEVKTIFSKFSKEGAFVLDELGLLTKNSFLAHCVHLSDKEIDLIAQKDAKIVHNPQSNLKLSSGISDICKARQKGVEICLGTDGCASNNNLDMIEEMRTAALLQKLKHPANMDAKTACRIAQNFGNTFDVGFRENALADIVLIDLDDIEASVLYNPASYLAYAANSKSVATVIINGRIVYKNKEFLTVDKEEVLFNVKHIAKKIGSL